MSSKSSVDLYALLGVSKTASNSDIKKVIFSFIQAFNMIEQLSSSQLMFVYGRLTINLPRSTIPTKTQKLEKRSLFNTLIVFKSFRGDFSCLIVG